MDIELLKQAFFLADLMGYDIKKYKNVLENLDELSELENEGIKDVLEDLKEVMKFIEETNKEYDFIEDTLENISWITGGLALVGVGVIVFLIPEQLIVENINQMLIKKIIKKLDFIEDEITRINEKVSEILNINIEIKKNTEILKEQFFVQDVQIVKEICSNIESYIEKIETKNLHINDIRIDELFNKAITILEKELEKFYNRKGVQLNTYLISNLYISLISFFKIISFEKKNIGENSISFEKKLIKVSKKFISNKFLDSLRKELIFKGILDNRKLNMIEEFFILKQKKLIENIK